MYNYSGYMQKTYYEINPPKSLLSLDFKEIWRYKELLFVFSWRDIKLRYKQTFLGVAWAVFQPFLTMVIFSIFFGRLAKIPSDGAPYPIFVYSGLLFWTYFSNSLTNASNSLVSEENIIKKVYFPRLILPISASVTPIIDFVCAFFVLAGLMIFYHFAFNILIIVLIPLLLLISLLTASGIGLFLSSVNVKYRDVRYILPFFIQILLYITPVIYPTSIIPENLRLVAYINPMVAVINTARHFIIGGAPLEPIGLIISLVCSILFFTFGVYYFKKTERFFADLL